MRVCACVTEIRGGGGDGECLGRGGRVSYFIYFIIFFVYDSNSLSLMHTQTKTRARTHAYTRAHPQTLIFWLIPK